MSQAKELEALGSTLVKLHSLLTEHEVNYAELISPILSKINNGDYSGVDELLIYNGGMGSLNDVFICAENGHNISKDQEDAINKEYASLLSVVWETAKLIQVDK